jgi:outer membrane protein OmpA-like peptidoglycan-associated protein
LHHNRLKNNFYQTYLKKNEIMKTLMIGFLVFVSWSAFSTYIYVCQIRGLCSEPISLQINAVNSENNTVSDSLTKVVVKEKPAAPKDDVIHFAFDQSKFDVNDQTGKYVDSLNEYLEQTAEAMLIITGHTDATGTNEYNQSLGLRRAQSVKQYLENKGITSKKMIIESKGEMQPVDNNSTREGRANNRRAVITIKK